MKKVLSLLFALLILLCTATPAWAEEDTDAPIIWMQTLEITYPEDKEYAATGDTVWVSVVATDNVGIKDFRFELESPSGKNNVTDRMQLLDERGLYGFSFTVDDETETGYWNLSRMLLTDTSDHYMYIRGLTDFKIGVHGSISENDVTLPNGVTYVYAPAGVKPAVTVTHRGITLKQGTDYKVTCRDNKAVGTGTVTVTGINCYDGKVNKAFTVVPQTQFTASLSCDTYYYTKEIKTPKVKIHDGKTRVPASEYTVTYPTGRKTVGTYAVKVRMHGNYSGSKTLYFTINPKNTKITQLSPLKKGFVLKWKKHKSQTKGYEIQYSTSPSFKNAKTVKIKNVNTTAKSVKKLKARTRYFVRIRTVNGKYHSKWSQAQSIKTK